MEKENDIPKSVVVVLLVVTIVITMISTVIVYSAVTYSKSQSLPQPPQESEMSGKIALVVLEAPPDAGNIK